MDNRINNLYEFGGFRFDIESMILWRGEEIVSLSPKALDVLFVLVENEGKLVTKQEILNTVWADTFVEEGVLTQNIYKLRNALGKDENGNQFIENIARRGYRFAVPIKVANSDKTAPVTAQVFEKNTDEVLSAKSIEIDGDSQQSNSVSENLSEIHSGQKNFEDSAKLNINQRSKSFRNILIGAGILIIFLFGIGIYQFIYRDRGKNESKIAPIEQLRFQRLTDLGDIIFPTISPDGEMLAYVRLEDQEGSVWIKQINGDKSIQILPSSKKGYRSLAFSPDGKNLYFREESDASAIYQTTILGGSPKKVADNVWSDFSVSPDGKQFVFTRRNSLKEEHSLIISNIDESGERILNLRNSPSVYRGTPSWSPDASKIIVPVGALGEIFLQLLTIDVSNGNAEELEIPKWRSISHVLWTPNGKHLIVSARHIDEPTSQIWMMDLSVGETRRLTNNLESYFWLSLSADGKILVTRQQKIVANLWILPEGDINKARQLTFGERNFDGYSGLVWTPDNKIIYSFNSGQNTELYKIDAQGNEKFQLTADDGQDNNYPEVSKDGRYIVFVSNRTGTTQVWRMNSDGGNLKQLTSSEDQKESSHFPSLSPDGSEVFFIKRGTYPAAIWKISIEGENPVQVSHLTKDTPEGLLSVSPDGKWITYRQVSTETENSADSPTMKIGLIQTDGNSEPKIFDLPIRRPIIQWANDSQSFYYSAGTFNSSSIVRQNIYNNESEKLIDFPDRVYNFSWSPDGKILAVSRGKQMGDAILITNLP